MVRMNQYEGIAKVKNALLSMQRYSWEQGVCAQAFLESGDLDTVVCLSYEAVNRQSSDGRLADIGDEDAVTDPVAVLEPLVKAYSITKDPLLKNGIDGVLRWVFEKAPRNDQGILYHMGYSRQFWVDSLYMLPPALLSAGYAEEAVKQADGFIDHLYDTKEAMFHHIWDDEKQVFANDAFWGVGNGWAICGLTRLIAGLPGDQQPAIEKYKQIVQGTINACLRFKREDGFFHNVIDRPDTFMEVNFPQMLCYAIKRGIQGGWLPQGLGKEADQIREAVHTQVSPYGFVKNVCGAPSFDKPGIAPEAQAFFLLMETMY